VEGSTLGEALGNLTAAWPGLRDSIYTGDTLHRFINIYINDDDVRYLGGLGAVLSEGDTITLLPAVAGGMSSYLAEPPAGAARAVSP
jgi:molybdopterin synthase sulfur carrier subunit